MIAVSLYQSYAFSGCRNADETHRTLVRSYVSRVVKAGGVVLVGDATGIDRLVRYVCMELMLKPSQYRIFKADWSTHGKAAGPIRNRRMLETASGLFAFWDGHSKGTSNAIVTAVQLGLPVEIMPIILEPK